MCRPLGIGVAALPREVPDPCGLPRGIEIASLPGAEKSFALRHALACSDLQHGRITADEFRARTAPTEPVYTPETPVAPEPIWATTVRDFSSQWAADNWSARQALGAPDIFPAYSDLPGAWASQAADGGPEHIELGYAPARVRAVEVLQTLNPGAVTRVELSPSRAPG